MIEAIIYGKTMPKERARVVSKGGRTFSYTPTRTKEWEEFIRYQMLMHRPEKLLDGPLALEATFYLLRPKSIPKKRKYPHTKPDLDNLIKAVCDALKGLIYTEDSRIVDKIIRKRYGDPPRVELKIEEICP